MTVVKTDSPPPAYSTIPSIPSPAPSPTQHSSSTATANPQDSLAAQYAYNNDSGAPGFQPHAHHAHAHGPTPIAQQQGALLPYYDPRSPYSMDQAVSCARWRFIGAILWALGIWVAFGIVTGGIVVDIRRA